jgi:hypothetical protein
MTLGALLAVICLIAGFIVGAFDGVKLLFAPETWFIAAIPLALLGGPVLFGRRAPAQEGR